MIGVRQDVAAPADPATGSPVRAEHRGAMRVERAGLVALLLLPGALTIYLGFNAGGFFPFTVGIVAVFLALTLVVRTTSATRPFGGIGGPVAVAAGALALLAAWTLMSRGWSHAPARSNAVFDRALLYLFAVILFGSIARTTTRVRLLAGGFAAGGTVVSVAGLSTRLLPTIFPTSPDLAVERLSYPITYWNGLGFMAALALVLCMHFASSSSESRWTRAAAAAVVPMLATTLYFTFSRGSIAAALVGVVAYAALTRSRAVAFGVLATAPPTAVAVAVAYGAGALASVHAAGHAGIQQGHRVAIVCAVCALVAGAARLLLDRVQRKMRRWAPPPGLRRMRRPALVAAVLVLLGIAIGLGASGYVSRQVNAFLSNASPQLKGDFRNRLGDFSSNGRRSQWDTAVSAFDASPFHGQGAGTYQLAWERRRARGDLYVKNAHSVYLETLAELGVVGLLLLLVFLFTLLVATFRRFLRARRGVYAIAFSVLLMWMLEAGVDWDWEMPAVTLGVFALAGAAVATHRGRDGGEPWPSSRARTVLAVGWLAAAIAPAMIAISEGRLKQAGAALARNDCREATDRAFTALNATSQQPRAYEIVAYCDMREGFPRAAISVAQRAQTLDPNNWQYRFDLALARGLAGMDPRPALASALAIDPLEPIAVKLRRAVRTGGMTRWRAAAESAELQMIRDGRVGRY